MICLKNALSWRHYITHPFKEDEPEEPLLLVNNDREPGWQYIKVRKSAVRELKKGGSCGKVADADDDDVEEEDEEDNEDADDDEDEAGADRKRGVCLITDF